MGAIKFFNGGQAVTEVMTFGVYNISSVESNYAAATSALPSAVYGNKELAS